MGMFDYIRCEMPCELKGWKCQTKSTDTQCLDNYLIKEDGTLWHGFYDFEDQSDPTATGIMAMVGAMTRVNQRWVQEFPTGEIVFYLWLKDEQTSIEYSAYFVKGVVKELHKLGTA
jgi:hypothetical protein